MCVCVCVDAPVCVVCECAVEDSVRVYVCMLLLNLFFCTAVLSVCWEMVGRAGAL